MCVCVQVHLLSCVQLFVTVVHQGPLSMGFPRQQYWSQLPFPPPGDLPDPGIEPASPAFAGIFFIVEPLGKPAFSVRLLKNSPSFFFSVKKLKDKIALNWIPKIVFDLALFALFHLGLVSLVLLKFVLSG